MDASMLATIAAALASNPEASRAFGTELARGFFASAQVAPAQPCSIGPSPIEQTAQPVAAPQPAAPQLCSIGPSPIEQTAQPAAAAHGPTGSTAQGRSQPQGAEPARKPRPSRARSADLASPRQPSPTQPAESCSIGPSPIEQKALVRAQTRPANIASPVAQRVAIVEDDVDAALNELDLSNY